MNMERILLKHIVYEIHNKDLNKSIVEFCDYSYLLREGRQINEFNIKDAYKKVSALVQFAKDKTGDIVGDAARKIYIKAANEIYNAIKKLGDVDEKEERDWVRYLRWFISEFIKKITSNPKLTVSYIQAGLTIISMIGSVVYGYQKTHDVQIINNLLNKLGVDPNNVDNSMNDNVFDDIVNAVVNVPSQSVEKPILGRAFNVKKQV